jgi:hypothetical protein
VVAVLVLARAIALFAVAVIGPAYAVERVPFPAAIIISGCMKAAFGQMTSKGAFCMGALKLKTLEVVGAGKALLPARGRGPQGDHPWAWPIGLYRVASITVTAFSGACVGSSLPMHPLTAVIPQNLVRRRRLWRLAYD